MRDVITIHVGETMGPVATYHPREEIRRLNRMIRGTFGGQKMEMTTHSQCVLNHLGVLISQGLLAPEEVQVIRHFSDGAYIHRFTRDGVMGDDWPWGFFNDFDGLELMTDAEPA